jgi:hypothetical protein
VLLSPHVYFSVEMSVVAFDFSNSAIAVAPSYTADRALEFLLLVFFVGSGCSAVTVQVLRCGRGLVFANSLMVLFCS